MPKILVADDEETIRELLTKFLKGRGYEVATAASGEEALEKMKEAPEIVLLDIMMPGMDGLQVLDKIKEIAPLTEVIIVTGLSEHLVGLDSFRRGAFEFITKPIDLKYLDELIDLKVMEKSLKIEPQP